MRMQLTDARGYGETGSVPRLQVSDDIDLENGVKCQAMTLWLVERPFRFGLPVQSKPNRKVGKMIGVICPFLVVHDGRKYTNG